MSDFEDNFSEWGRDSTGAALSLTVETFLGNGSLGASYAAPEAIPGLPQFRQNRLVRTAQGNEVLASSKIYVPLAHAHKFTLHSRVTLADGRASTVLNVARPDQFGLFGFVVLDVE